MGQHFKIYLFHTAVFIFWVLAIGLNINECEGQGFQTTFGKNIVQYKDFNWSYYQTRDFDVYFYEGGKEPARFVLENGDKCLKETEKLFEYPLGDKFSFIVFNSYQDFLQSNFRHSDEDYNVGGKSPILSNKVFIYLNGDHFDFINQMKAGIARVTLTEMIVGSSLQERLQNNVLLNIPEWFTEGLITYISHGWDAETDSRMQSQIEKGKFKNFNRISNPDKITVSYYIWKYINDKYGSSSISNIIYSTRLNRSYEVALESELGKKYLDIYHDWLDTYQNKKQIETLVKPEKDGQELDLRKIYKKGLISRWEVNPTGTKAAFVTQNKGRSKIYLLDFDKHKKKCIYRTGYRKRSIIPDQNYPIIAFNPLKDELAVFYYKKGNPYYLIYDLKKKKKTQNQIITGVQNILGADIASNGKNVVVSAIKNGQTDLFLFDFKTQIFKPLTDDIYDDKNPKFTNEGKSIVFSSNRPDKYLRKINTNSDYIFNQDYNCFQLPDWQKVPKLAKPISDLKGNEISPSSYDSVFSSYLSDENGILNLNASYTDSLFLRTVILALKKQDLGLKPDSFVFNSRSKSDFHLPDTLFNNPNILRIDTVYLFKDSVHNYQITDYKYHLLSYKMFPRFRWQFELFDYGGKYHLFKKTMPLRIKDFKLKREIVSQNSQEVTIKSKTLNDLKNTESLLEPKNWPDSLRNKYTNYFVTDFEDDSNINASKKLLEQVKIEKGKGNIVGNPFRKAEKKKPKFAAESIYFLSFSPDLITTQLDNNIGTTNYQPYKAGDNTFFSNNLNGFFKVTISDVLKDYKLTAGMRLITNLSGAEYFLSFENLKKRLDQKFMVYRRGETKYDGESSYFKIISLEGRYEVKYPFSEIFAIRGSAFLRNDQTIYQSSERTSLETPNFNKIWSGFKSELVFDNSFNQSLNIPIGFKAKAYQETFFGLNVKNSFLYTIGLDARYYLPLGKHAIWANRFSSGSSFGTAKIVYFLGGTDGWIFPDFNAENQVNPKQNYVYKAQAQHLRGFTQNARNGSSFMVINSELRLPIFRMLYNRPLKSAFFDNFQMISFFDMGSSWNGILPTNANNLYSQRTIVSNPFIINVTSQRDPFIYGIGYGFRSTILGYFIRFDYGYGIEEGEIKMPVSYLSLGLDF